MSIDTDYLDASQGWTLQQALERTAHPPLWDAWIAAKAALEKMNALHPSAGGAVAPQVLEKIRAQRDVAAEMFDKLNAQLREQLLHGLLRAAGSRGSPGVFPTSIETTAWANLRTIDPHNSVVQEPGERGATIHNVRIFPLIHFDAVMSEIPGCSLAEAFRRFVLNDPEVLAAQKRIPNWKEYEDVFVEGQVPGYIVSFEWPVELSSEDLAYNFVRPIFIDLYAPLPEAPPSIHHVARIITDRWQRFRQRLIAGELVARGTYARTGMVQHVDPLQWARQGVSVDVKNSDLVEDENHKSAVRWSGVTLSSPPAPETRQARFSSLSNQSVASIHVPDAPPANKKRSGTRSRPVAQAVARALKAHGLDQSRGENSLKQVASIIASEMPKPPKTEPEMLALAKAIRRHYEGLVAGRS